MNKFLLVLLSAAFIFTAQGFAQTPPPATPPPAAPTGAPMHHMMRHPEIHRAMRKLRGAREDLEKAASDYGGHKAKAMDDIDAALSELHEALAVADSK